MMAGTQAIDGIVAWSFLSGTADSGRTIAIARVEGILGYEHDAAAAAVEESIPRVCQWTEKQARQAAAEAARPRPVITVNRDQGVVMAEARGALALVNDPPVLFRKAGHLARIGTDDEGRMVIMVLNVPAIRAELATWMCWQRETKEGTSPAGPPTIVVDDLSARADQLGFLPVVRQIVTAPVFAPDGTLETEPGYIASAQVWYEPVDGMAVPPVPVAPTRAQVDAAVSFLLVEYLGQFPLKGPSDWAHIFALMVLPFVREMIEGSTPNHGASAPTPGTGKGKLVTAALLPALGRMLPATPPCGDETEMRKELNAIFLSGQQVIRFDNLSQEHPMRSPSVSLALTEPLWQVRILGVSLAPTQRLRTIWVMTGNNLTYSQEIARRTVPILLDLAEVAVPAAGPDGAAARGADGALVTVPQIRADGSAAHAERPWQRTGFRHPDLLGWGTQHRGELVAAILTIVRGWLAAGRPPFSGRPLGSFEEWSRLVGGITEYAGIAGFLDGTSELYDDAVSDADEKAAFCEAWLARFGEAPVSVADLTLFASGGPDPFGIASDWMSGRAASTAAGIAMRKLDGAVHGGIRIRKHGQRGGYRAQRIT